MSNIKELTSAKTKWIYCVLYFFYIALSIANPIFIMLFIDACVGQINNEIILYSILAILDFIFLQLTGYFFSMYSDKIDRENFINFYTKLDDLLAHKNIANTDIDNNSLAQTIGQNYEISKDFFFKKKADLIFSILQIIITFAIMFYINWTVSLILLILLPISFIFIHFFQGKLYKLSKKNIDNMEMIKSYISDENTLSKEERFLCPKQLNNFFDLLFIFKKDHYKNSKYQNIYLWFFAYCFLNLAILIVLLVSGYLTSVEIITIGVLTAFWNYTSQLWSPGEFIMSYFSDYQEAKPAIENINEILDTPKAIYKNEKINSIELKDFAPLNKENDELTNVFNYEFKPGHIYLITGENGVGKTTLVEAILGFNNRYSGKILINKKEQLNDDFVYVSADAYISPFYSEELAKGSSGEQKLSQILLFSQTDKSVYIFDEPTNFIDKNRKHEVMSIIEELKNKNKLVIVVSHDKFFLDKDFQTIKLEKK